MIITDRTSAINILNSLREEYNISDERILDYLVNNYLSGSAAKAAMESVQEEFGIGDDEELEFDFEDEDDDDEAF